jgi:uncharacterized protein (UPF0276 family)
VPHSSGVGVGIGYRRALDRWIRENLRNFDVIEITVDHCLSGDAAASVAIYDLVGRVPLTAHGIGLSIGTAAPLDLAYLDRVVGVVDRLRAPAYSEHLAFTRVPGRDLANLLPLPKTEATAAMVINKVQQVQRRLPVPFLLENIAYLFDWPDSTLSDAEFFALICGETGAGMLLDIENLHVNAHNHRFDPYEFLDALPPHIVKEVHMAGGIAIHEDFPARPLLADSHSHPVPEGAFALLDDALVRHAPASVILERDERLDATDEILDDVVQIRAHLVRPSAEQPDAEAIAGPTN